MPLFRRTLTHLVWLLLLVSSCSRSAPAQTSRDPLERLRSGETAFLATAEPRDIALESGYAVARALEAQGMSAGAREIYRRILGSRSASSSAIALSATRLAEIAADRQDWAASLAAAATGLEHEAGFADLWFVYGRALYEAEELDQLSDWTRTVPPPETLAYERRTPDELEAEVLLWQAVAEVELSRTDTEAIEHAFTAIPSNAIHRRIYLYLFYRDELERFSPDSARVLEAVYRTSIGEFNEALRLFAAIPIDEFVERAIVSRDGTGGLFRSVDLAATRSGQLNGEWLSQVETAVNARRDLSPEEQAVATARIVLLVSRSSEERIDDLTNAIFAVSPVDAQLADRLMARRAALTNTNGNDDEQALAEALVLGRSETEVIALLEPRIPVIVRDRAWDRLADLRAGIPLGMERARATLALLLVEAGRWDQLGDGDVEDALEPLTNLRPTEYGSLAARRVLGQRVDTALAESPTLDRYARSSTDDIEWMLARGLFDAGLIGRSYELAMRLALDGDSALSALALADDYHRYGYVSQALGLARRAVVRGELPISEAEVALLYPTPYSGEFRAASDETGVSAALLYGVVREESHFNPRARSPVGAEGLSQLMPATAEEWVSRLRLGQFDAFNPSDNLTIGSNYLAYLDDQLDSPVLRVAAYNAGLGRGRRWYDDFGDLSPFLQIEAIPFRETRWYLRRVSVSTAWYERGLNDIDPVRAFDQFLAGELR